MGQTIRVARGFLFQGTCLRGKCRLTFAAPNQTQIGRTVGRFDQHFFSTCWCAVQHAVVGRPVDFGGHSAKHPFVKWMRPVDLVHAASLRIPTLGSLNCKAEHISAMPAPALSGMTRTLPPPFTNRVTSSRAPAETCERPSATTKSKPASVCGEGKDVPVQLDQRTCRFEGVVDPL